MVEISESWKAVSLYAYEINVCFKPNLSYKSALTGSAVSRLFLGSSTLWIHLAMTVTSSDDLKQA